MARKRKAPEEELENMEQKPLLPPDKIEEVVEEKDEDVKADKAPKTSTRTRKTKTTEEVKEEDEENEDSGLNYSEGIITGNEELEFTGEDELNYRSRQNKLKKISGEDKRMAKRFADYITGGVLVGKITRSDLENLLKEALGDIPGVIIDLNYKYTVGDFYDELTEDGYSSMDVLTFLKSITGQSKEALEELNDKNKAFLAPVVSFEKSRFIKKLEGGLSPLGGDQIEKIDLSELMSNPIFNTGVIIKPVDADGDRFRLYVNLLYIASTAMAEKYNIEFGKGANQYKISMGLIDPKDGITLNAIKNKVIIEK